MRKSLVIIASALFLAVAAATHDRLRYDSTVFVDPIVRGGAKVTRVEYPPCVRGVREDRCIQLYERGVRRSYQRWLASHGRGERVATAAPGSNRVYRACRGRGDDRCQQRATRARGTRHARAQVQRRSGTRATVQRRAQAARRPTQTRTVVRVQNRAAPAQQRHRPGTRTSAPRPTRPGGGTPGI